jgi:hypothetical protein
MHTQFKNKILANLSMWDEHHSIELRQKSHNVFVIRDLKILDFHLISFCNNQFDLDTVIHLNISIKKTEYCQTNFTIYLTAGLCIAIIDLDNLEILSGEAKEREGVVQASKKEDGWIDLTIKIKLDFPSPIYLGCALNNQPIYEGFEQDQFYIEDSISINVIQSNLKNYLNYVKYLAQEGKILDAIDFYHSQIERPLSDQQIYQLRWKDLNELGKIPENLIDDTKISKEDALRYFEQNSKYKTINLSKISPKTNQIIEKSGLSTEYLKIILGNNQGLEEIYINIVQRSSDFKFSKKQTRKKDFKWPRLNEDLDFQQSIVETGYLYTVCPFQGKILKSNQSFYVEQSQPYMIAYRFQSIETFYLIVGHWGGAKLYLYFPNQELIIYINEAAHELLSLGYAIPVINNLKSQFVSNWDLVKRYISNDKPIKKVVVITANIPNLGHFWWNNLTGLEYLVNNQLISNLDKILLGNYCYFDINLLFSEIETSKLLSIKDNSSDLFSFCLESNYVLVYFSNTHITSSLSQKIFNASIQKAEATFLAKVEEAKQHFPLLWINLRSHNKIWVSQVSGYIQIITNLAQIYPNLAIVFDGLPAEKEMMVEIQSAIPETIKTYSAIECKVYESIIWARAIDAYIAVVGSGLTLVTWIANKPGVVHADSAHMGQMVWWQEVGHDSILPLSVPKEHIHDLNPGTAYTDYECDWLIIYELILEIIKVLPPRNNVQLV